MREKQGIIDEWVVEIDEVNFRDVVFTLVGPGVFPMTMRGRVTALKIAIFTRKCGNSPSLITLCFT
jgi:hypothetical protein